MKINIIAVKRLYSVMTPLLVSAMLSPELMAAQFEIEEVVITAQKRSESLQDIPIAISAFSGADLDSFGVKSAMDLQLHSPGLVMGESSGWGFPTIRGVGNDIFGPGVESSVAMYVNGAYQSRSTATTQRFSDVERIEVLKGPQAVLYGRNATGGVINIVTKTPGSEWGGDADIQFGNYDQVVVRGSFSGPLMEDRLLGGLSVLYDEDDGYFDNRFAGNEKDGGRESAVRGSMLWAPSEVLSFKVNAAYSDKSTDLTLKPINPETNPLFTVHNAEIIADPYTVNQDSRNELDVKVWSIDTKVEYELDTFTVTSITAYQDNDHNLEENDADATEVPLLSNSLPEQSEMFSQELIFNTNSDGPLQWTALLFYLDESIQAEQVNDLPLFGVFSVNATDLDITAYAAGAQLEYELTHGLKLIGGARYNYETKEAVQTNTTNGALTAKVEKKPSWNEWTWRGGIEWTPDEDSLYYASVNTGFKSGGFNASIQSSGSFEPEEVLSYEVGAKLTMLEGRMRTNMAAFYYDYTDMQVQSIVPPGLTLEVGNAAESEVMGIELEVLTLPVENLEIGINLAYLKAEFSEYEVVDPDRPELGIQNLDGNPLPRAPELTASVNAKYTWQIDSIGELSLLGSYYYRDDIYFTPFEDERMFQPSIELWDAQLALSSNDGSWNVAVFGHNLSDETYIQHAHTAQALIGQIAWLAKPRTYGIRVGYKF